MLPGYVGTSFPLSQARSPMPTTQTSHADIAEAPRQTLASLDSDVDAQTSDTPWTRQARPTSSLSPLASFKPDSRVLCVAKPGAGRVFLTLAIAWAVAAVTSTESSLSLALRDTSSMKRRGAVALPGCGRAHQHRRERLSVARLREWRCATETLSRTSSSSHLCPSGAV